MMQIRKVVSTLLTISSSLALSSAGMVASAYAAQLKNSRITVYDNRSTQNSAYKFEFSTNQADDIDGIRLVFSTTASGAVTVPTNFDAAGSPTTTDLSVNGGGAVGTTVTKDGSFSSSGLVTLVPASGTFGVSGADQTVTFTIGGFTNPDATANACDAITNTESCYVRISTYKTGNTVLVDSSAATFTVIASTLVTATVDPSLTFAVAAVASGALNGNDANANCGGGTTNVTTTGTTIPFGNIRLSQVKCAQQDLQVITNALGYSVYHKFIGAAAATNMMQGQTNSANNIDPYTGTYGTPTAWTVDPTGSTASVNTGWLGIRSTSISAFATLDYFAGPQVNNTSSVGDGTNKVMNSATPDLGTTHTFVTFKLRVNALQPTDTYQGTMTYLVTAQY